MSDSSFINDDAISRMNLSETMNEGMLWAEDKGTLPLDARRALLQLLRGPFVDAVRHKDLWNAILNNQEAVASRLNDLLLDLIIDTEAGIAFVRNAGSDTESFPKAVRAVSLTLSDTIMILTLRHELLTSTSERAIVGHDEIIDSLGQYRPVARLDESSFHARLERSWNKLRENGILLPLQDTDDRFEISPALAVVFGVEEVRAASEAISELLEQTKEADDAGDEAQEDEDAAEIATEEEEL